MHLFLGLTLGQPAEFEEACKLLKNIAKVCNYTSLLVLGISLGRFS